MNHSLSNRSLVFLALGLLGVGIAACDEGSSQGSTEGGGGTGNTSSSTTSSGGNGSGGGSGGGSSLTLTSIDDCEDKDGSITPNAGLMGAWYTYNDETAGATQAPTVGDPFMMAPVPKPHGSSTYAAHTTGSGFTTWGAGFGFDFNNNGTTKSAFDASAYAGVTFWATIGTGGIGAVRFNVGDSQTTLEAGNCGAKCSDDFGASLSLTGEWQQFTFRWADLKAVNWSMQNLPGVKNSALYSMHWQAAQNTTFDIWVDDVAFFKE